MKISKSRSAFKPVFTSLLLIITVIISCFSFSVNADSIEDVPYENYTYWEGYSSKKAVVTKASYEAVEVLQGNNFGIGNFKEVQHMFSYSGFLYVLDSANGRIIKFDKEYNVTEQITSVDYNGQALTFNGAKGLFIDQSGLYIADTLNKRILCVEGSKVFKIIEQPEDATIPATFAYSPTKLVRDSSGYLYVLCEGSYYGMMVFSDKYEFFGFFGANNVTTTLSGAIQTMITSLFDTEEKHSSSIKRLPYTLLDICIDADGFIAAINNTGSGQLRLYGLSGTSILKKNGNFTTSSADGYNFADTPFSFVDQTSQYKTYLKSAFSAVTADDEGYYYAIDSMHGRIFVYDKNCQPITIFGGGKQRGTQMGTFVSPSSVVVFNDDLLVSDFSNNKITVFRLTDYGRMLRTANSLTIKSDYTEAKPYWEKIYAEDKNCQLAYRGLAKAALAEKDYETAMDYAKLGLDTETYALAFEEVRNNFISGNFWIILPAVVLSLFGITTLLIRTKRRNIVFIKSSKLRTALRTMLHPLESFNNIKYKEQGSWAIASIFMVLFYVTTVLSRMMGGFMFGVTDLSSFNSLLIILGTAGIVVLWTISNWLVCVLFEGKGSIKQIYCASCYSLMPMLIYNIGYVLLSNFMLPSSNSPFELFGTVCYLLTAVLILLAVTVVHDFTLFKAIGAAVVTLLAMAIVGFVVFAMLTLWQELLAFVVGIYNETTLR